MGKKKSNLELRNELKALRKYCAWSGLTKVVTASVPWVGGVFISHEFKETVSTLAGKLTAASFDLNAQINSNAFDDPVSIGTLMAVVGLAILLGIAGIIYGAWQDSLRRATIEALTPFKLEHERQLDAKRSSSGLTQDGQTNPDDK